MFRNLWKTVQSLRLSGVRENRILKGTDRYGNRYYEFNDDDTIKRKIEFAEGNEKLEYESEFWHEWLKYQTEHPMSQMTIDKLRREREQREKKNKDFDKEEADIHAYNLKNNIK